MDAIIANLKKNVDNSKKILKTAILKIDAEKKCACQEALKYAIITDPKAVSAEKKKNLGPIISKYIK